MNFNISSRTKDLLVKLNSEKCFILHNSFAQLHVAQSSSPFIYSKVSGLLCFLMIKEVPMKFFFRLFSPETLELLFECELYYNFWNLNEANEILLTKFFYFEVPLGFIGFLFINERSCEEFKQVVKQKAPAIDELELNQKLSEIQKKNNLKNKNENKPASRIEEKKENSGKTGKNFSIQKDYFYEIKNQLNLNIIAPDLYQENENALIVKRNISSDQSKMDVNFEFDKSKSQFNLKSLSPETKCLFKKAGIKKKELINPEIAPLILEKFLKFVEETEKSNNIDKPKNLNKTSNQSQDQINKNDKQKIEKVLFEKMKSLERK